MHLIYDPLREAVRLLLHNDNAVYEIAWRTVVVSGTATLISLVLGVAAGAAIAFRQFHGRLVVMTLVNTGMGLPPVVVGLIVAQLLWRSGPLGNLEWIYTIKAMIIAQTIIATPVVVGFTAAALGSLHPRLRLQIYALGASRSQALWLLLQEVRLPLLAALMAGFGAAISEVGASVMVGGNIAGQTRVLTGAVLLEEGKGNFAVADALGIVLLAMMIAVNGLFTWVQFRTRRDRWGDDAVRPASNVPVASPWAPR